MFGSLNLYSLPKTSTTSLTLRRDRVAHHIGGSIIVPVTSPLEKGLRPPVPRCPLIVVLTLTVTHDPGASLPYRSSSTSVPPPCH